MFEDAEARYENKNGVAGKWHYVEFTLCVCLFRFEFLLLAL